MRIAIVAPEFPPEIGGVQTYSWHMASGLARLGHEVTVFARKGTRAAKDDNFTLEPTLELRRRRDRANLQSHQADVWHCMSATYAWLALDIEQAPVFVSVHGNDFLNAYHPVARLDFGISDRFDHWLGVILTKKLLKEALPKAQHIFANSHYTEEVFLQHNLSCVGRTSVASVGIAPDAFATHEGSSGINRFTTVCRLGDKRKNIPAILEALARLKERYAFHYIIAGDGPLRPELEALARRLGLDDRVSFAGHVSQEEKKDLLRRSDLFVMPSTKDTSSFEGFGLVYLEANACGTPALAARIAGAIEAVEEGVSGYFVEAGTPDNITTALVRFLSGDITFEADRCQRFAQRFSWEGVVQHCAGHYEQALASRQSPAALHPAAGNA